MNFKKLENIRNFNNYKRQQNETIILNLLQTDPKNPKINELKEINKKLIESNQRIVKRINDYQIKNRKENIFKNDMFLF